MKIIHKQNLGPELHRGKEKENGADWEGNTGENHLPIYPRKERESRNDVTYAPTTWVIPQ
jgi:hypothetical protein